MYDIFLSYSTEDRDRLQPPFGFAMRQVEDFTSWDGRPDHPAFIELAAQIYGLLNDGQQPSQVLHIRRSSSMSLHQQMIC